MVAALLGLRGGSYLRIDVNLHVADVVVLSLMVSSKWMKWKPFFLI